MIVEKNIINRKGQEKKKPGFKLPRGIEIGRRVPDGNRDLIPRPTKKKPTRPNNGGLG